MYYKRKPRQLKDISKYQNIKTGFVLSQICMSLTGILEMFCELSYYFTFLPQNIEYNYLVLTFKRSLSPRAPLTKSSTNRQNIWVTNYY